MVRRVDKDLERNVINTYQQGSSMKKTASDYNISPVTVMNILNRNNIPKRTSGRNI